MERNPCADIPFVPEPTAKAYVPSTADVRRLLLAAPEADRVLLRFLMQTMCRVGEAHKLTWEDVDLPNRTVTLRTRKRRGGHEAARVIPIDASLTSELETHFRTRHPTLPYVFWNPKTEEPWRTRGKLMKALCRRAGIRPFGYHSLRRFGATMLADKGVPVPNISTFLGHTSTRVTDRYLNLPDDSLRAAAEKFAELGLGSERPAVTRKVPPKSPRRGDRSKRKARKVAERVGFEP